MTDVKRVGIDLGKQVFHLTAVDGAGRVLERARLRRAGLRRRLAQLPPGTVVAMEACGSARHWARHALALGHEVRLMGPHKVAPHMRRSGNDANDADGTAEAASCPEMRFVGVKSVARQRLAQLHRARRMAVRNRTAQANQPHGFLLEWGIESRRGIGSPLGRLPGILEDAEGGLTPDGRALLSELGEELRRLDERAGGRGRGPVGVPQRARAGRLAGPGAPPALDRRAHAPARHQQARRPMPALPAGPRRARRDDRRSQWAVGVAARRGRNVATVALANRNARTAWAVPAAKADFDPGHVGRNPGSRSEAA